VLLLVTVCCFGQTSAYPKPQTASAVGQPTPDFNLKDQNGNTFTLSKERGSWVLLFFYRGYW
jgi:cytochrome oxidase Cu insertion factor (SCO1/SenC/PrrC family)